MRLQCRNLYRPMHGDDIQFLRAELRQLGYSLPPTQGDDLFDEATYQAVSAFQRTHGLNPSGEVDEAMARAIKTPVNTLSSQKENFAGQNVRRH